MAKNDGLKYREELTILGYRENYKGERAKCGHKSTLISIHNGCCFSCNNHEHKLKSLTQTVSSKN
jgi:hypothetical protein